MAFGRFNFKTNFIYLVLFKILTYAEKHTSMLDFQKKITKEKEKKVQRNHKLEQRQRPSFFKTPLFSLTATFFANVEAVSHKKCCHDHSFRSIFGRCLVTYNRLKTGFKNIFTNKVRKMSENVFIVGLILLITTSTLNQAITSCIIMVGPVKSNPYS